MNYEIHLSGDGNVMTVKYHDQISIDDVLNSIDDRIKLNKGETLKM